MPRRVGRPPRLRLPAAPLPADPITKAAFARALGCAAPRVTEWCRCRVLTPPAVTPDGLVAPRLAAEQLLAAGAVLPPQAGGHAALTPDGAMTFDQARTALETLRAHHALADLQERQGSLVPRELSDAVLFAAGRALRDSWIGWPARVAAVMAARLEVDPAALLAELDRAVRDQLAAVADPTADWRRELKGRRAG